MVEKETLVEQLRQRIQTVVPTARETNRAEADLCALSFQSALRPERHVWISAEGELFHIDLEDWTDEAAWDDAVARLETQSPAETVGIVNAWLAGEPSATIQMRERAATVMHS